MVKATVACVVAILFAPAGMLLGISSLLSPVANASCRADTSAPGSTGTPEVSLPETSRVVFPLSAGTSMRTSGFGIRVHPITGEQKLHTGVDFAAPSGTQIIAAADGRVAFAGPAAGYGNLILIEHTVDGQRVASGYAHMSVDAIHVEVGEAVTSGQYIADVGMAGYATGPHLHFEIRPGGANAAPADPEPWLAAHGAAEVTGSLSDAGAGCATAAGPAASYAGDDPGRLIDDPTTDGQITERTAHILAQVQTHFPESRWSCWSERAGTQSEHPLGHACDGTFGNSIGTAATGPSLDLGWEVTNWMKENAQTLGIAYLIWQGRIWSLARSSEGWRPYDGGGMHDPSSVTGGHLDHCHWTSPV